MKYCGYCGNPIPDDMVFCPKCGKKQTDLNSVEYQKNNECADKSIKKTRKPSVIIWIASTAVIVIVIVIIILVTIMSKQTSEACFSLDYLAETTTPFQSEQPTPDPTAEPFTIVGNAEAIENLSRSVVKLTCYDKYGNEYASGSGFFAFENNLIVTNYHVIEGNVYSIVAASDGKEFNVDYLVNYNERYDLAILKIKDSEMQQKGIDFEPLPIGDSSILNVSEHITAIGVPLGVSKTVSDGIISGFYEDNGVKLIQFTAPISPGSSGGALLNDHGEVIGITSASFSDGQNFNLTVPSSYISILYNADARQQKISSFYDHSEHYYSVDYCLANHNLFRGYHGVDTISIVGYVSSYIKRSNSISCYLVSDPLYIDGTYYIEGKSSNLNQNEKAALNNHINSEIEYAWNLKSIKVFIVNDDSYESILVPGNYVVISGMISEVTDNEKHFGKMMLEIFPTNILVP